MSGVDAVRCVVVSSGGTPPWLLSLLQISMRDCNSLRCKVCCVLL